MSTVLVLHDYLEVLRCLAMYEGFDARKLPRRRFLKRAAEQGYCFIIRRTDGSGLGSEYLRFTSEQIEIGMNQ